MSLRWRAGKIRSLELAGAPHQPVKLRYGAIVDSIKLDARGRYRTTRIGTGGAVG